MSCSPDLMGLVQALSDFFFGSVRFKRHSLLRSLCPALLLCLLLGLSWTLPTSNAKTSPTSSSSVVVHHTTKHKGSQNLNAPVHSQKSSRSAAHHNGQLQARHENATGRTSHLSSGRHRKTAPVVAEQTSSRHGRRHRLTEVGKQKTHVATTQGHRQEPVKPSKPKKEEEEVETIEPPSIRVDSEELARAYARYDSGINKRLSGNYLAAITDLQEARQIFHEHALKESPMESFAALELGQAADEAGNYYLARRIYEELKAKSPSSLSLRLKLARLEAKNGDIYDALREAREAVSLDPTAPEAHMMLSLILDRAGSAMEAIVEKQRASELAGRNLQAGF
jgi:hypothetical protein